MPNWVDCYLYVEGDKTELKKFKNFGKNEKRLLSADRFIPYPEKYRKMDEEADKAEKEGKPRPKDGYNSGGYEWCIENWGTKWDFNSVELVDDEEDFLSYSFLTAWSPPIPVVKKMSEMFPKLKFTLEYYEGSMGFKGLFVAKNGKVIEDYFDDNYREEEQ